jgi:hypothetical protein
MTWPGLESRATVDVIYRVFLEADPFCHPHFRYAPPLVKVPRDTIRAANI